LRIDPIPILLKISRSIIDPIQSDPISGPIPILLKISRSIIDPIQSDLDPIRIDDPIDPDQDRYSLNQ
jgi:hypothetical protein